MRFTLPAAVFDEMRRHAVAAFPDECCGLLVERGGVLDVVRVTNVQNDRHAENPEAFPRTAETAYTMGPEAAPILVGHERGDLALRAFYHSHPQHDAYFSAEDKKQATVWDDPSYPDAAQIVISVYDREVKTAKAFHWSESDRDFVEIELALE
jgi:proteasome lid subunit RPN8/RPN11